MVDCRRADCPTAEEPIVHAVRRVLHRPGSRRWLAGALAALGCTNPTPHEPTVLARVPERVVILPLNIATPMPAELKNASSEAWSALEVYLRAHGATLKTVAYPTARGLWVASVRDAKADPKLKDPGFDDAARLLVAKLKQAADFDALIIPWLYVQRATLSGTTASWDGSDRTVEFETRRGEPVPRDAAIEGAIPAVSLRAAVYNGAGSKLHEGHAGIGLLVRVRVTPPSAPNDPPSYSFLALEDPFADRQYLLQQTARALSPFVPLLPTSRLAELSTQIKSAPPASGEETAPSP
jgi:hypothetical protein